MGELLNPSDIKDGLISRQPSFADLPKGKSVKISESFVPGTNVKAFQTIYPFIKKNEAFHTASFGTWSFHQVINYLIRLAGPCNVLLASWAFNEEAMRMLVKLQDEGFFNRIDFGFDDRIIKEAPNAWQVLSGNFKNIWLGKVHAKLCLIRNDNYGILISSSANLSTNRRLEYYVITENQELASFTNQWLKAYFENDFRPGTTQ